MGICSFNNTITERDMDMLLAQAVITDPELKPGMRIMGCEVAGSDEVLSHLRETGPLQERTVESIFQEV